jgi:hypothetical protein
MKKGTCVDIIKKLTEFKNDQMLLGAFSDLPRFLILDLYALEYKNLRSWEHKLLMQIHI